MSTILVIESNYGGGAVEAFRAAQRRGLRTHFLCRSTAEYEPLETSPVDVADDVTVIDTFDMGRLSHFAEGLSDVSAVLAYDDPCVLQAAFLAEQLGLPGPLPAAVARTRFKDRLRLRLAKTAWHVRHEVVPLAAMSSPIGYPCVVKPCDVAGNYGVAVCHDEEDFKRALSYLREFTSGVYAHGYRPLRLALVEDFLPGTEYSAEMVWSSRARSWRLVGFTTKALSSQDLPIEVEHIFPHSFGPGIDERLLSELNECLDIVGLSDTVVHVEFRVADGRMSLIEVNCRPAGGRINELVELARGASLIDLHLAAHLGDADSILDTTELRGCAGIRFLLPRSQGVVERFVVDPAPETAVVDLWTAPTPLRIDTALTGDSRIAHVVVRGEGEEEVSALLDTHIERIHPCYATRPSQPRLTRR